MNNYETNRLNNPILYSENLQKSLGVKNIIDNIEKKFNLYLSENNKIIKKEIDLLKYIKIFIYKQKDLIQTITKNSQISEFDCLTLSIITCLLSKRKGYDVKIGRPDKITRYFHSLIIRENGQMFKIAGKSNNYEIIEMSVDDIISRLKLFTPIINFINSTKEIVKNYIRSK